MRFSTWWPTLVVVVLVTVTDLHRRQIPKWSAVPFVLASIVAFDFLFHGTDIGPPVPGHKP